MILLKKNLIDLKMKYNDINQSLFPINLSQNNTENKVITQISKIRFIKSMI